MGRATWQAVLWIVLALVWATGLVAGLLRVQREPSPVMLLGGYAVILCLVIGYGVAFSPRSAPSNTQTQTTGASPQTRVATLPEHTLRPQAREAAGRGAVRLQARDLHEQRHLQQVLDSGQFAVNKVDAVVVGGNASANAVKPAVANTYNVSPAKPATEKPVIAEKRECNQHDAWGPGRLVTLDTQGGGEYGLVQFRKTLPLNDKEVVFTFDDGPHPVRTPQVLDILDRYCIKAVFFMIGDMAERNPELVREIQRRGHTIGTHTWSHPLSLAFLSEQRAEDEIEHGFAAVSQAAGTPISPFFRFPGLGYSKRLLDHLAQRDIAVWSVDVVSGDSEGASAGRIPALVMSRLEKHGRGVLLFHDIKKTTIEALPTVIERLREEGYSAAQVVPATPFSADPGMIARLNAHRHQAALRYGRSKIR